MRRLVGVIFIVGSLVMVGLIVMRRSDESGQRHDDKQSSNVSDTDSSTIRANKSVGDAARPVETKNSSVEDTSTVNQAPSTVNQAPSTVNQAPSTVNQAPSTVNQAPSTVNQAPSTESQHANSGAVAQGEKKQVAAVSPEKSSAATTGEGINSATPPTVPVPEKPHPNFPGIEQKESVLMVSQVRHKEGEGEDAITVTLSRTDGSGEITGDVWVIGEYVQRGTTGVMFMPSHNELKLGPDGKPKNPRAGERFQLRTTVEKKMTVRRPGFDGEELIAVRVGVVDNATGEIHMARVSTKQMAAKSAIKRAKVTTTP